MVPSAQLGRQKIMLLVDSMQLEQDAATFSVPGEVSLESSILCLWLVLGTVHLGQAWKAQHMH